MAVENAHAVAQHLGDALRLHDRGQVVFQADGLDGIAHSISPSQVAVLVASTLVGTLDMVASVYQGEPVACAVLIECSVIIFISSLGELHKCRVFLPVCAHVVILQRYRFHRPEGAGDLRKIHRLSNNTGLFGEDDRLIIQKLLFLGRTGDWLNGSPVEVQILQPFRLLVEEVSNIGGVALSVDAVVGDVCRCTALPDDASRTVVLIAYEQSGIQVGTHIAVFTFNQRISHDTG